MKIRKKIGILFLCIGLLFPTRCEAGITEDELYARAACLMDADSGRVLFGKNAGEELPMASTTKIMTCILALEAGQWEDWVTVSERAAGQPAVHMGANAGEQFLLGDLIYALMLESDNDAAVMIAEHVSGSVESFVEEMNRKAADLGCVQTHFVTPNGLDGEDDGGAHRTTAADLARIMRYCISGSARSALFLEITQTAEYSFWNRSCTRLYQCSNHNAFLNMMDGAQSGKTGFTAAAGYCYVGSLSWEGKTFIVALLACGWPNHRGYKWSDARKLMLYGLEQYAWREIKKTEPAEPIPVANGQYEGISPGDAASLRAVLGDGEDALRLLLGADETVRIFYDLPESLKAPIEKGEKIGTASVWIGEEKWGEYSLEADRTVGVRDYPWCVGQTALRWLFG